MMLFEKEELNRRKDMPQVKGDSVGAMLMKLVTGGILPHAGMVAVDDLQPLQQNRDIDSKKVTSIVNKLEKGESMPPVVISLDNYILDGHHRVEGFKKAERKTIMAIRIPLNADEALTKVKEALKERKIVEALSTSTQAKLLSCLESRGYTENLIRNMGFSRAAISEAYQTHRLTYNPRTGAYTPFQTKDAICEAARSVLNEVITPPGGVSPEGQEWEVKQPDGTSKRVVLVGKDMMQYLGPDGKPTGSTVQAPTDKSQLALVQKQDPNNGDQVGIDPATGQPQVVKDDSIV